MAPGEVDDDSSPEMSTELTRARRLVSYGFVTAVKAKFKTSAIERMKAEKEVCSRIALLQ